MALGLYYQRLVEFGLTAIVVDEIGSTSISTRASNTSSFRIFARSLTATSHIKILLDSIKPNLYIVYTVPARRLLDCQRVADFHRFDTTR
ncbi:hypothetical protein FOVSG1_009365 [Fusarium oxysporum f. sp. vasinfectum]